MSEGSVILGLDASHDVFLAFFRHVDGFRLWVRSLGKDRHSKVMGFFINQSHVPTSEYQMFM